MLRAGLLHAADPGGFKAIKRNLGATPVPGHGEVTWCPPSCPGGGRGVPWGSVGSPRLPAPPAPRKEVERGAVGAGWLIRVVN